MQDNGACSKNLPLGVSPNATIGKNVTLGPYVVIASGAQIKDNVTIEAHAIIYENVIVEENSFVGAQCILGERLSASLKDLNYHNPITIIGAFSTLRSGTIIYASCRTGRNFQTGNRAVIREESFFGDDCSFGTLSQSDGQITVGNNCRFHNNVFISTYTTVENNVHFYPMSCTVDSLHPPCQKGRLGPYLESGAIIGAKVLLLPRVRIGANAIIAGASVVTHDIPANMVASGVPARIIKTRDEVRCHLEDRPAYEVAIEV